MISQNNLTRIHSNLPPVVDRIWLKSFPEDSYLLGSPIPCIEINDADFNQSMDVIRDNVVLIEEEWLRRHAS